jgi:hypothetical protein
VNVGWLKIGSGLVRTWVYPLEFVLTTAGADPPPPDPFAEMRDISFGELKKTTDESSRFGVGDSAKLVNVAPAMPATEIVLLTLLSSITCEGLPMYVIEAMPR